jgi:hypothetical protein
MKYFIIYAVGFFLTFGYFVSTYDQCDHLKDSDKYFYGCKGEYAVPRAYTWPIYWPMVGSWYLFGELLGK